MNILKLAGDAGMLVVLDGRIGCAEYRSVDGTFDAFQSLAIADGADGPRGDLRAESSS
ncbi:hypothetical protein [Paraburkholderia panacisoli]|uniref:hypothetical protein n=1 Tax=Paraburkholderia panacisoli TaxID=2603818 RepID=UPI00165FEDD7|nr:hypothetical protein [Paraburkholderia panacisoli]